MRGEMRIMLFASDAGASGVVYHKLGKQKRGEFVGGSIFSRLVWSEKKCLEAISKRGEEGVSAAASSSTSCIKCAATIQPW